MYVTRAYSNSVEIVWHSVVISSYSANTMYYDPVEASIAIYCDPVEVANTVYYDSIEIV